MGAVRGKDGNRWIHVRLPGRPSGHTGWIFADQTVLLVDRMAHRRQGLDPQGHRLPRRPRRAGVPGSRPQGLDTHALRAFFVEEALAISPHDPGGPYALAISARSDIFQEFKGGPGQIAIHGMGGLSDPLGSAASHGCIRISPAAITWMSSRIGGGVPVTVER